MEGNQSEEFNGLQLRVYRCEGEISPLRRKMFAVAKRIMKTRLALGLLRRRKEALNEDKWLRQVEELRAGIEIFPFLAHHWPIFQGI